MGQLYKFRCCYACLYGTLLLLHPLLFFVGRQLLFQFNLVSSYDVGVISMITGSLRATRFRDPPSARALVWLRPTTPSLRGRVNKSFTHFCTSATWVMTFDTVIIFIVMVHSLPATVTHGDFQPPCVLWLWQCLNSNNCSLIDRACS